MHALNAASLAPPEEADPLGAAEPPVSVPGACAQPARARAAEVARAPTRVRVFFTDGLLVQVLVSGAHSRDRAVLDGRGEESSRHRRLSPRVQSTLAGPSA